MRAPWMADVLRQAGLGVVEVAGWRGRGRELASIEGIVLHHTATPTTWSDQQVANLLRDGRSDLRGPLCQLGLDRAGRFWIIADGRGNHNGYGEWGNDSLGIEAFHVGTNTERWSDAQLRSYKVGTAALLRKLGLPESRCKGHRETDPKRKTDPIGLDLNAFRREVRTLLEGDDDDMAWSDDEKQLMLEFANAFLRGAPAAGVNPVHTTVARIDRMVGEIGEELGMERNARNEIVATAPSTRVGNSVRKSAQNADPELRRNLRRVGERLGVQGQEGAADPPQRALDVDELAAVLVDGIAPHLRSAVDPHQLADAIASRLNAA